MMHSFEKISIFRLQISDAALIADSTFVKTKQESTQTQTSSTVSGTSVHHRAQHHSCSPKQ